MLRNKAFRFCFLASISSFAFLPPCLTTLHRHCSSNSNNNSNNSTLDLRKHVLDQHKQQFVPAADPGDYFRIASLEEAAPPQEVIEWKSSRGSGPGGQATNTASNKAELRVNLERWQQLDPVTLCDETYQKLLDKNQSKITVSGQKTLIVSSHMHRSLEKNKEECLQTVQKMVREASYVPPAAAPRMKFDPNVLRQAVEKKRSKANFNRMKRSVRTSGKLSGSSW